METIVEKLLHEGPASVRYRLTADYLNAQPGSPKLIRLQEEVRQSEEAKAMLAPRNVDGKFPWHAYQKWKGAFWTLLALTDLGYPAGDKNLQPLAEQDFEWLLDAKRLKAIPFIDGRWRRCACQESGAVFSMVKLGLADARVEQLVELLLKWQWPDGGWNCDKHPEASHSSFHESFIPLRALNAWWQVSGDPRVKAAMDRTAELFLSHHLYKRSTNMQIINPVFTKLSYPITWHYDILWGLRALNEAGFLSDPCCGDALDLLESKRLADGGFPAEARYYQVSEETKTGTSYINWGGTGNKRSNPYITAEVLCILKTAGRRNKTGI
jgi:hypothetical protein